VEPEGLLVTLIIAFLIGSVGARLAGRGGVGCLGSIALGFIGAVLGQYLAAYAKLPAFFEIRLGGERFSLVWAVLGSALVVAVLSLVSGRRHPE